MRPFMNLRFIRRDIKPRPTGMRYNGVAVSQTTEEKPPLSRGSEALPGTEKMPPLSRGGVAAKSRDGGVCVGRG